MVEKQKEGRGGQSIGDILREAVAKAPEKQLPPLATDLESETNHLGILEKLREAGAKTTIPNMRKATTLLRNGLEVTPDTVSLPMGEIQRMVEQKRRKEDIEEAFRSLNLEQNEQNMGLVSKLLDRNMPVDKISFESARVLTDNCLPLNTENMTRAGELLKARFRMNSDTLRFTVVQVREAKKTLLKYPWYAQSISTIAANSMAGPAQGPSEKRAAEKRCKAELEPMLRLAQLAPERTMHAYDVLVKSARYRADVAAFENTEHCNVFFQILQERLAASEEEDRARDAARIAGIDKILDGYGLPPTGTNRKIVAELTAAGFEVNEASLRLNLGEIRSLTSAFDGISRGGGYYIQPQVIVLNSASASKKEDAEPTEKEKEAYHFLSLLVSLAPEKTKKLVDSMLASQFYKQDMEEFLSTGYGMFLMNELDDALKAKKQEAERGKKQADPA